MTDEEIIRQALNISIYEGIGATIYAVVIQGFFLTKIGLEFGADAFTLSLLLGIQLLSQVIQLFVPRIISALGRRKPFVIFFVLCSRSLWLLILILSVLNITGKNYFMIIVSSYFICSALVGNAWTSWMKDLVPQKRMGRFFGFRNLVHSFCSLVFTWIYSTILNQWPTRDGVEIILFIGLIAGFISVFVLSKQYEPPIKEILSFSFIKLIKANKNFQRLLIFGGCWNFSILFSASFFAYHEIENLNVSFSLLGYLSMAASLIVMLFYWIWGKIADKIGHKNILRVGICLAAFTSGFWFLMTPQTMDFLLWVDVVSSSLAWSAINIAIFTLPMLVGGESAILLIAFLGAVNGICGFAGSLAGGFLSNWLVPITFTMGTLEMEGIQFLFLGSGIFRLGCLFLLNKVSVVGHIRLRTVMFEIVTGIARKANKELADPTISKGITEKIEIDKVPSKN